MNFVKIIIIEAKEQVSMDNIEIIIAGAGVFISVVVAWITAHLTYRNEISKKVYGKREKVYIECFSLLEELRSDRNMVFENTFFDKFNEIKPRIKMYSSNKMIELVTNFFNELATIKNKFDIEDKAFNERYTEYPPNGRDELEMSDNTEGTLNYEEYKIAKDKYCYNNMPDKGFIDEKISEIITEIRKSMKTKK
jgi:hypothetical protein